MRRFSVRGMLVSVIGLIAVVLCFFAVLDLEKGLARYRFAERVALFNFMANDSLLAVNDFAFERGRSLVILRGGSTIVSQDRAFIAARRQQADRALHNLLARYSMSATGLDPVPGMDARQAWETIRRLRVELDRDFELPLGQRDAGLAERWRQAANLLITSLERVLVGVSRLPGADVEFDRMSSARVHLHLFRDTVGQETGLIAAMLSARVPPSANTVAAYYELRGRANQQWKQLEMNAGFFNDPDFNAALDQVRAIVFARVRPLCDDIMGQMAGRQWAWMPVEEFTQINVPALEASILAIDAIARATERRAKEIKEAACRQLLFNGLAFGLAALLLVALLLIVHRRVVRPLNAVVARIHHLRGADAAPAADVWRDEFVAVTLALDLLDQTLVLRAEDARLLAESNARLAHLTVTDGLTGLANRRHLNERLRQEWARARRVGTSLAVLLVDVDHFKRYNDAYGHQAGDEALIKVARVLAAHGQRAGDCVARYGGEEFVLLLPGLDTRAAQAMAEDLCRAVAALALPHAESEHGVVTLSIGVAVRMPIGTLRVEDLLLLADVALYQAKNDGRNRVVCTPEPEGEAQARICARGA